MDLVGSGRRLSSAELPAAANKLGVDLATLRAILQVETAGARFDAKKRLKLLFEHHIFYRQLGPGPKRDQTVKKDLAYRKARTRPYPPLSKRYEQIAAAIGIDETAALTSAMRLETGTGGDLRSNTTAPMPSSTGTIRASEQLSKDIPV